MRISKIGKTLISAVVVIPTVITGLGTVAVMGLTFAGKFKLDKFLKLDKKDEKKVKKD